MKTVNPIGGLFAATSKYSYARVVISSHYPIISPSREPPLTKSFGPVYIVGVVFAIAFGSRRDVLLTLMFWRRNPTTKGTTHTSQPAALLGTHAHADVVVEVNPNPTFGINRHTLYYPGNVESLELEDQKSLELEDQKSSDYRAKLQQDIEMKG
jgi:hypothetical protein